MAAGERIDIDSVRHELAWRVRNGDLAAIAEFFALEGVDLDRQPPTSFSLEENGRGVRADVDARGHPPLDTFIEAFRSLNRALARTWEQDG